MTSHNFGSTDAQCVAISGSSTMSTSKGVVETTGQTQTGAVRPASAVIKPDSATPNSKKPPAIDYLYFQYIVSADGVSEVQLP